MSTAVREHRLYHLHFADDWVILRQDENDIHYIPCQIDEEYRNWGLIINPSNTEYLVARLGKIASRANQGNAGIHHLNIGYFGHQNIG